jgi:hypothetical protein
MKVEYAETTDQNKQQAAVSSDIARHMLDETPSLPRAATRPRNAATLATHAHGRATHHGRSARCHALALQRRASATMVPSHPLLLLAMDDMAELYISRPSPPFPANHTTTASAERTSVPT